MKKKELISLLKLLDDPDPLIYQSIKENLINKGKNIIPLLEDIWTNNNDILVQQRVEEVIKEIRFKNVIDNLNQWSSSRTPDLAYGAFIIAEYFYPEINWQKLEKTIDMIKQNIWLELNANLTALEKIRLLNHIFFETNGFIPDNDTNPQNFFINNILDKKRGNPTSIAILYIAIAQRLNLPIFGINLPENLIAAYVDKLSALEAYGDGIDTPVLFYINPFNYGKILLRQYINQYLKRHEIEVKDEYFKPSPNSVILKRYIKDLMETYDNLGFKDKANELNQFWETI